MLKLIIFLEWLFVSDARRNKILNQNTLDIKVKSNQWYDLINPKKLRNKR